MSEKKVLIIIVIVTILLLGGSISVLSTNKTPTKVTASQNARAEINQTKFDWGKIDYSGPKATKTFKISNTGTEPLKLTKIKTSCTCTTAQLIIDGKKSPLFSMHGGSQWVGEIKPGKEAELEVVFNQTFHGPSGTGPIERFITVETNDASKPKLEFSLKGNVVK